jgi:enoyl-[acyl-carrier protein] reductase II
MRDTRVCQILAIDYPILQAGMPWVSNPELVSAISDAGGMGILHPSAGMDADEDMEDNLRENMRKVRRLTGNPFGVSFYLANPLAPQLIDAALEEGMRIAVTYGGSPALYTGILKNNDVTVLHQVSTVRHARGAEAQGVDMIIAEGYEGGGIRGPDESPNLVLVPQVVDAVSIPVIASGGIMDARGYVAALSLGAQGVQMGTRFVATHECIAHPRYKEALLGAIDTGTLIAGRYHRPTRVLRSDMARRLKDSVPPAEADTMGHWESELGPAQVRAALLEGDPSSIAYCGAGVGLVSEISEAAEIVRGIVKGAEAIIANLS